MYTVWVDDLCIYSPVITDDDWKITDSVLTEELNKCGSFEFMLPPTNRGYNHINKMTSLITVKEDNEDIWWGRVTDDERDFFKRKNVYCEGILAYLLDSHVRPYDYSGDLPPLFNQYITEHNSRVESAKRFTIGSCTVTDSNNYVAYSSKQYPKTLDEINEKLVKTHGGYLFAKRMNGSNIISYQANSGGISDQIIEFGKNLLDFSEHVDATGVITVLIPLGKKTNEEFLTIKSVNNGKDYLENQTGINLFGRIEATHEWKDVTVASNLKSKGQSFLSQNIEQSISLSIKAVDLHLLDVDTERIELGSYVRVISIPHGLDRYFQCSKIVRHLQDPSKNEYIFGVSYSSLTSLLTEAIKGKD